MQTVPIYSLCVRTYAPCLSICEYAGEWLWNIFQGMCSRHRRRSSGHSPSSLTLRFPPLLPPLPPQGLTRGSRGTEATGNSLLGTTITKKRGVKIAGKKHGTERKGGKCCCVSWKICRPLLAQWVLYWLEFAFFILCIFSSSVRHTEKALYSV